MEIISKADLPSIGVDLTCPTCGSQIGPLLGVDNESIADTTSDADGAKPARKPALKAKLKPRRAKPKPGLLHFRAVRQAVRIEMLARVPGMNRPKARAVVEALPGATMSAIMRISVEDLADIEVGDEEQLGDDVALALKRAVA